MKKFRALALALTMSIPAVLAAQPGRPGGPPGPGGPGMASGGPGPGMRDDPLGRSFFPPELVMEHQEEIGLQDAQRNAIQEAIQKAQSVFVDRQWKLAAEVEKLKKLVDASSIDEAKALDQVDRVLAAEREIKRTQLSLMIRIKNTLTEAQRQKLSDLRGRRGSAAGGGPPLCGEGPANRGNRYRDR